MRDEWDRRARRDALHYIADWRAWPDPQAFFASGEATYLEMVVPALTRLGIVPAAATALEVGCGVGRITRSLAGRFGLVLAEDVSGEMLREGRMLNPGLGNVRWIQTGGSDLALIRSESVDFVFSHLVLQHVPDPTVALGLVGEMARIVRKGGGLLFQFSSAPPVARTWRARLVGRALGGAGRSPLGRATARAVRRRGGDPLKRTDTWLGTSLDPSAVREALERSRTSVLDVRGSGTRTTWCLGAKSV
jgi:SAM-dependent methyltransferase